MGTTNTERRTCTICGESEGSGVVCYAVWAWNGKFMGRWCDWCRHLRCHDCGREYTDCRGSCEFIPDAEEAFPLRVSA